jgi:hypothetical protein
MLSASSSFQFYLMASAQRADAFRRARLCTRGVSYQPPPPPHLIVRGRTGPNLLAQILAAKYGQHLPLTRQTPSIEGVTYGGKGAARMPGSTAAACCARSV